MTQLQTLTQRIKAVLPEIDELKMGCRVKWYDGRIHTVIEVFNNGCNQRRFLTDLTNNHCGHNFGFTDDDLETEIVEILGRPITALDFLRCLSKNDKIPEHINIYKDGVMRISKHLEDCDHEVLIPLDKTLDQLDDPTIATLNNLL